MLSTSIDEYVCLHAWKKTISEEFISISKQYWEDVRLCAVR